MATVFSPTVLMQGQEYQHKGYVLNIRLSDGLLKARVKGRSGPIYDVHIDLKIWPGRPSRCSCQAVNCKHAAASLLAMQVKENIAVALPGGQDLGTWIEDMAETRGRDSRRNKTSQIIYLLSPDFSSQEHRLLLRLAVAKCLKRGGLGKKQILTSLSSSRKEFFFDEDEEIISGLLYKFRGKGTSERLSIRNSEMLHKILATKRAYLSEDAEEPLQLGSAVEASCQWVLSSDGFQRLGLDISGAAVEAPLGRPSEVPLEVPLADARGSVTHDSRFGRIRAARVSKRYPFSEYYSPLFLDTPWYYQADTQTLGPINTPYSSSQWRAWLALPAVFWEDAAVVAKTMAETQPNLPLPRQFASHEKQVLKPLPVLSFDACALGKQGVIEDFDHNSEFLFMVTLAFDYQGFRVLPSDKQQSFFEAHHDVLVEIKRDLSFEKAVEAECIGLLSLRGPTFKERLELGQEPLQILSLCHTVKDLQDWQVNTQPILESKGWLLAFDHPVYTPEHIVTEDEWFSEISEKGQDFFSYQLGILIEGKPVSIVPLITNLINKYNRQSLEELSDEHMVAWNLPNGKRLRLSMGRIKPLLRFLLHYGTKLTGEDEIISISRYQLLLLQETELALTATALRWRNAEQLQRQLQQLVGQKEFPEAMIPVTFQATLRDYQHQGVSWLQFLRESRFSGVLADDMGLGKTVQTLAHLQTEKAAGRLTRATLIVAPTSLVGNWYEEAKRFTPDLSVLRFHGQARHQDNFEDYDLIISTYGLIQRDKSRFVAYDFYYLILDEAQCIKNARAKTTQIIQQIKADHRLCLSGTPLENHLGELWSLFHFLMPGLLGDAKQFRVFFKTPIEKNADKDRQQLLANRVRPFMLRRTKAQVESQLPPKTEILRRIELDGVQRDLYEAIRMSMEKKVREAIARQGLGKSHIVLLDALLKLRQVCCDPRLLSLPEAQIAHGTSAKLEVLMELLDSLVAENRRVLVFSQFTSMLSLIQDTLKLRQYPYLTLTGQTQNRQQLVNKFQEGEVPIFLISLRAGGTGLNLTRADTVIHYDPWWNPAVEDQATDRSHRIGQENPVFVYKLITSGTVEEAILAMQDKKRELFEGLLSDSIQSLGSLNDRDIEQFFMPL